MIGGHSGENLRRFFAGQFEPNERGYLYRRGMKGAPVQVSAAERDAFVAAFDRQFRWGRRIGTALVIATCVVLVIVSDGTAPDWWGGAVGGGVAVALVGGYWWIRNAPARALERRPAVGNPRDGAEMRRLALQGTSYPTLVIGLIGCGLLAYAATMEDQPTSGWHPYAIGTAVVLAAIIGWQIVRKSRL